jgi:hypothetical protein
MIDNEATAATDYVMALHPELTRNGVFSDYLTIACKVASTSLPAIRKWLLEVPEI